MRFLLSFVAVLTLCLSFLVTEGRAETPARNGDITGLWAYRTSFPVGLQGDLTISRHGGNWHASIGETSTDAAINGLDIRLMFPDGGGAFRGSLDPTGNLLTGFWVRREMTDDPRYPLRLDASLRDADRVAARRRQSLARRCAPAQRSLHALPDDFPRQ